MISLSLGIPQIIYCIILFGTLCTNAMYHKQTKKIKLNFWSGLIACGIEVALLTWGGFFG